MIFVVMNSDADIDCILRTDKPITAKRLQQMIDRANARWEKIEEMTERGYARLKEAERQAYAREGLMGLVLVLYPKAELEILTFEDVVYIP